ncbi:MAG: competence/damage-inducible protein A [Chloroflexi bacterium]|nr:competence/damage-inducible protein A [Chloroflexota bacterium]
MEAEIVAIGTELLLGVTVDTNSAYLAQQLGTIGVPVRRVTLVRDDLAEIVTTLQDALGRVDLVICSGGLGPTGDDLTREAIAQATGRPLEFHQTLLDDIAARFAAFKRTMSDSNRQQAYVPQGAHIIRNPRGTAPAFVAEGGAAAEGRLIAALPGVPQELSYLTENALLPYLRDEHGLNEVLVVRELRVSGLTEADAGERIADIMLGENPVVGITAKRGQHTIRIAAKGEGREAAEALIEPLVELIRQRFGAYLLGEETVEQRVARLLAERGVKLALVETDLNAPVYRTLTETSAGKQALVHATIQPALAPENHDYPTLARSLAAEAAALKSDARLVLLIEPGEGSFKTVHLALGTADSPQIRYLARGFDWGLPQASDFVATAALELLRRWLEASGPDAAFEESEQPNRPA